MTNQDRLLAVYEALFPSVAVKLDDAGGITTEDGSCYTMASVYYLLEIAWRKGHINAWIIKHARCETGSVYTVSIESPATYETGAFRNEVILMALARALREEESA